MWFLSLEKSMVVSLEGGDVVPIAIGFVSVVSLLCSGVEFSV